MLEPELEPPEEQTFPEDEDDDIPIEIQDMVGRKVMENPGCVRDAACALLCAPAALG